jgi:hypothetical protein
MDNLAIWNAVRRPPVGALKDVQMGGRKFSDINPVWRLEAMTEQFGTCGIGWSYEIKERWTDAGVGGEIMCFVAIEVRITSLGIDGSHEWSAPIPGFGGSMLIAKNKNGLQSSDEAWKMALTDALSVAFKALGVAADIYRGFFKDSKYSVESKPYIAPESSKSIEDIKQELDKASRSGGDAALRLVWSTIDVNTKPLLRDYLKALRIPKVEKAVEDISFKQVAVFDRESSIVQ